jgi:hypothetical protein
MLGVSSHPVLTPRERANLALLERVHRAQDQARTNVIAEQKNLITEKENVIAEKDNTIANMEEANRKRAIRSAKIGAGVGAALGVVAGGAVGAALFIPSGGASAALTGIAAAEIVGVAAAGAVVGAASCGVAAYELDKHNVFSTAEAWDAKSLFYKRKSAEVLTSDLQK